MYHITLHLFLDRIEHRELSRALWATSKAWILQNLSGQLLIWFIRDKNKKSSKRISIEEFRVKCIQWTKKQSLSDEWAFQRINGSLLMYSITDYISTSFFTSFRLSTLKPSFLLYMYWIPLIFLECYSNFPSSIFSVYYTANIYDRITIKLQPMVVPPLPFPGSNFNQYSL